MAATAVKDPLITLSAPVVIAAPAPRSPLNIFGAPVVIYVPARAAKLAELARLMATGEEAVEDGIVKKLKREITKVTGRIRRTVNLRIMNPLR